MYNNKTNRIINVFFFSFIAIFLALLTHYSSYLYSRVIALNISFIKIAPNELKANIKSLLPGEYFISLGRPRGICSIYIDDQLIDSNATFGVGLRDSLLVGASFRLSEDARYDELKIKCRTQQGFQLYFSSAPIVSSRGLGLVLQTWRSITQILFGPVSTLFLFFYLVVEIIISRRNKNIIVQEKKENKVKTLLFFSIISFLYAVSLSYATRLWLTSALATDFHIFIRSVFSFCFFMVCCKYTHRINKIFYLHLLQITVMIFLHLFYTKYIVLAYKISYLIFICSPAVLTWEFRKNSLSRINMLFMSLCFTFTVLLPVDYIFAFVLETENLTPSIITILCFGIIYIRSLEGVIRESAEIVIQQISNAFEKSNSVEKVLTTITQITSQSTRFSRSSAYLDGYFYGVSDTPEKTFVRICETGYRKDTTQDKFIEYTHDRGKWMQQALSRQEVIVNQGNQDLAWFAIVPLGKHACINISDDQFTRKKEINTRIEMLQLILPILNRFKDRLTDFTLKQCLALEKLRVKYGHHHQKAIIGSIFIDIDHYSLNTEKYGEPYLLFVSDVYMPALIKKVGVFAAAEYFRGDEVYFVVVQDLIPQELTVEKSFSSALKASVDFVENEGFELCNNLGFPKVTVKIGAAIGAGTLVCDSIKVRTSGQSVNEAKRLMDQANENQILLRSTSSDPSFLEGFHFGPEFTVIQKKNIISARVIRSVVAQNEGAEQVGGRIRIVAEG